MPPISEPGYEFTKVPAWKLDQNFVVVKAGREETFKSLAELLLCCNEAVQRQHKRPSHKRGPKRPYHAGKPLLLEYMSDRVDIDDPLGAYMVRTKDEGWLQGFVTYTTFTTWHKDFRWDSLDANAEMDVHSGSNKGRVLDLDASLSRKLQAQVVLFARSHLHAPTAADSEPRSVAQQVPSFVRSRGCAIDGAYGSSVVAEICARSRSLRAIRRKKGSSGLTCARSRWLVRSVCCGPARRCYVRSGELARLHSAIA